MYMKSQKFNKLLKLLTNKSKTSKKNLHRYYVFIITEKVFTKL